MLVERWRLLLLLSFYRYYSDAARVKIVMMSRTPGTYLVYIPVSKKEPILKKVILFKNAI